MPTTSDYPGGFDSFENPNTNDKVNDVVKSHSNLHKKVNSAIVAIEATLGANPQGAYLTVLERLTSIDTAIQNLTLRIEALEEE